MLTGSMAMPSPTILCAKTGSGTVVIGTTQPDSGAVSSKVLVNEYLLFDNICIITHTSIVCVKGGLKVFLLQGVAFMFLSMMRLGKIAPIGL